MSSARFSTSSSDPVLSQIAALKSAYATLSDVVVEETDAIRADATATRSVVNDHTRDLLQLQEDNGRMQRAQRSADSTLEDLKRDVGRLDHRTGDAMSLIKSTEAGTAEALTTMQAEINRLSQRMSANEERTRICEEVASEAIQQAKAAQAELMESQAASKAAHAAALELKAGLEASLRDHQRFAADVESRLRQLREGLRDLQAQVAGPISSGLTAAQGTLDRTCQQVSGLQAGVGDLKGNLAALQRHTSEASTALAKDVAMLADSMATLKANSTADATSLSTRIASVSAAGEEARRAEAEERERRIGGIMAEVDAKLLSVRKAVDGVETAGQKVKEDGDATAKLLSAEIRALQGHLGSLESSVHHQLGETQRRLDDVTRAHSGRLDAVGSALHAFANVLNLGTVVVDPKQVMSRSMAAAGVLVGGSGSGSNGGGGGGGSDGSAATVSSPTIVQPQPSPAAATVSSFNSRSHQQQQQQQQAGQQPVYGVVPSSISLASPMMMMPAASATSMGMGGGRPGTGAGGLASSGFFAPASSSSSSSASSSGRSSLGAGGSNSFSGR